MESSYVTSRMLIETGLSIAQTPRDQLTPLARRGGVFPSSLAAGEVLAQRLRSNAHFDVSLT